MIYLKLNGDQVEMTHFMPFDKINGLGKTKEQLEGEGGVFVENVPNPENREGKMAILKYNRSIAKVFYEYIDRPFTQDEEIAQLKKQQALMKSALDDMLMMEGGL